jgi:excinuclease UvrABC helicase subunit UvrB
MRRSVIGYSIINKTAIEMNNDHEMETQESSENIALSKMDGSDLNAVNSDYLQSLHYKINQQQLQRANGFFQTKGQILGINHMKPEPFKTNINFGETSLNDYTTVTQLGKGTYGEVNKCVHGPTQQIVAIKTFFFEVSFIDFYINPNDYRMSQTE